MKRAPLQSAPGPSAYAGWARWCALILVGLSLVILGSLFWVAAPLADDFCRASAPDAWEYTKARYLTGRSGRWATSWFEAAVLARVGLWQWYPALLIVFWLVVPAGVYFLIRGLWRELGARHSVLVTTLFTLLYWSGMPSPGDTVYWFCGLVDYLPWTVAAGALVGALLRWRWSAPAAIAAMLAAFCLGGSHELSGVLLCPPMVVGAFLAYRSHSPNRHVWAALAAASLAGFVSVALAPAHSIRMATFPEAGKPWRALYVTGKLMVQTLPRWALDGKLLAATLLFVLDPRIASLRPEWYREGSDRVSRNSVVVGTWIMVLAGAYFAPSLAAGIAMPGRAQSWLYLVFLMGWFLTVFLFTREWAVPGYNLRPVRSLALVIFAGTLLFHGNPWKAIEDYRGPLPAWRAAVADRHQRLLRAKQAGDLDALVPALPAAPATMRDTYNERELASRKDRALNRCAASYYGLRSVGLTP